MEMLAEYVSKQDAQIHRKHKTVLVEQACGDIVTQKGTVTPDMLLEAATDRKHALHDFFDWDDSIAGYKWRKVQATAMIISTRYVCFLQADRKKKKALNAADVQNSVAVRRFLPSNKGGFVDRASALSDEETRKSIIERKLTVLRSWCQSVIDIAELAPVREAIIKAIS